MRMITPRRSTVLGVGIFILLSAAVGCSSKSEPNGLPYRAKEVRVETQENDVPGTVNDFWEEPMYDNVDVPAAIDPEGVYYRPSHETIVEIRHGRHQRVQYPDGEAKDKVFRKKDGREQDGR